MIAVSKKGAKKRGIRWKRQFSTLSILKDDFTKKKIESKTNSPSFELCVSRLNRLNVLNCSFSMKGAKIPINIVSKARRLISLNLHRCSFCIQDELDSSKYKRKSCLNKGIHPYFFIQILFLLLEEITFLEELSLSPQTFIELKVNRFAMIFFFSFFFFTFFERFLETLYLFWVQYSTWHKWAKTNENFFHFLLLPCLDVCGLFVLQRRGHLRSPFCECTKF